MQTEKISLACDPGKICALLALSGDDRRILFATKLVDGVPPTSFELRYIPGEPYDFRFMAMPVGGNFPASHSDAEILVTLETHNWKVKEIKEHGKVWPNSVYKHGEYKGMIKQWLVERGFAGLIHEVEPKTWQQMLKGCPGDTPKERAEYWVKEVASYCHQNHKSFDRERCKMCETDCSLRRFKIIGPKGGYDRDLGDALCIANWRLDVERVKG